MLVVRMPPYIARNEFEVRAGCVVCARGRFVLGVAVCLTTNGCAQLVEKLHSEPLRFPQEVEELPHLKNLIMSLMEVDPAKRVSLHDVMCHEWVTEEGSNPLATNTYLQVAPSDSEVSSALDNAKPTEAVLDELSKRRLMKRQHTQRKFKQATGLAPLHEHSTPESSPPRSSP